MPMSYTHLRENQTLIAQDQLVTRDGGRVIVELIHNSETSVMLSHHFLDDDGVVTKSTSCGYCDGVLIGCVDCPNNDPYLNCIDGTISCQT